MYLVIRTLTLTLAVLCAAHARAEPPQVAMRQVTHGSWSEFLNSQSEENAMWERAHAPFRAYPKVHGLYRVLPNQMLQLEEGAIEMRHMEMWNDLRLMVKEPLDTLFTAFLVYTGQGDENLMMLASAFVQATVGAKHIVGVNLRYKPSEVAVTRSLMHELGHALLHVTNGMNKSRCGAVDDAKIEIKPLVAEFYAKFWEICDPALEEKRNRSHVTIYAATKVGEDLADTWVSFIVCSMPRYDDERIVAQKKRMMWNDPELRERREYLRRSLGAERVGAIHKQYGWYFCRE